MKCKNCNGKGIVRNYGLPRENEYSKCPSCVKEPKTEVCE